jgi:hypothetical protein
MSTSTPHSATVEAFTRAVLDDYAGSSRYPDGAIVLPSKISWREFMAAVKGRDPKATPVVFVRDDGVQTIMSARPPRRLRERALSRLGWVFIDIEVRDSDTTLCRGHGHARNSRDVFRLEHRAVACI